MPQPLPHFGIGQAVIFFGRRIECLGQQVELFDKNAQFARSGPLQFAVDADQVSQVETFSHAQFSSPIWLRPTSNWIWPVQSRILMKISFPFFRSSTMRPAARTRGPCCTGSAALPSSTGGAGGESTVISVCGTNGPNRLMAVETLAPGIVAELADLAQLFAACFFRLHLGVLSAASRGDDGNAKTQKTGTPPKGKPFRPGVRTTPVGDLLARPPVWCLTSRIATF